MPIRELTFLGDASDFICDIPVAISSTDDKTPIFLANEMFSPTKSLKK